MLRMVWLGVLIVGCLIAPPRAIGAKRVALVIGNSAYEHTAPLTNPKHDAADMSVVLKALGFRVIEGLDLDKAEMDRIVRDFADALSDAQAGLFFYAGHGLQVAGENYLVPTDAKLTTAAALDFEMLRLALVQRVMERATETNIIFLDACRDNPLARNLARAMGTRSGNIGRGLAAVESGVGTLISFSTQPGNVALDGTGRNSPFAAALVKQLSSTSEDLSALLIAVRNDVMQETQRKQVPWEHSALTGRFYFNTAGPTTHPTKAATTAASEAAEAWDRVKDASSVPMLEAFIARYPDSLYGDLARMQIKRLKEQHATADSKVPRPQSSKPTLEETKEFIVNHVRACPSGKLNYREAGRFSHIEHTERYNTTASFDGAGRMTVEVDIHQKDSYNHAQKKKVNFDAERLYIVGANLADLDTAVAKHSKFDNAVVIRCTKGPCIASETKYKKKSEQDQNSKDKTGNAPLFFCDASSAQRLGQALSHAIALSGGKRAPF
jgi:hypothetical protein